jgi:hypothetical protein
MPHHAAGCCWRAQTWALRLHHPGCITSSCQFMTCFSKTTRGAHSIGCCMHVHQDNASPVAPTAAPATVGSACCRSMHRNTHLAAHRRALTPHVMQPATVSSLKARGQTPTPAGNSLGVSQAIAVHYGLAGPANTAGKLLGASDSRKDGAPLGY